MSKTLSFSSSSGDIKANGTVPLTANWSAGAFSIIANSVILGSSANIIAGGAGSGGNLALISTTNATRGKIRLGSGTIAVDELNDRFGIGTISPTAPLHVASTATDSIVSIAGTVNASGFGFGNNVTTAVNSTTQHVYGWYNNPTLTPPTAKNVANFSTQGTVVAGAGLTIPFSNQIDVGSMTKSGSGTVTNGVGIYLRDQAAGSTANYGVYQDGSNFNYFNGKIGIGQAVPTARLHIAAGTATANTAPLKFTTGTNLTVAVVGVMEYNNTFHLTNSDATRRHIALAPNNTKVTAGAPYTNDGYVVINIGGTDFKIMTTA